MAYAKDPKTGVFLADIKDRVAGRVHVSLRTKNARVAAARHAAVEALVRQHADAPAREVLRLLRRRKLNVEAVASTYEGGRPFGSLLAGDAWPRLGDAIDQYLGWVETHPGKADATHVSAAARLKVWRAELGEDVAVDQVASDEVERVRKQLVRQHAEATVAQYLLRLGSLYTWLQQRETRRAIEAKRLPRVLHAPIDRDLVPSQATLRSANKRVRFLSSEEAQRLLAATPASLAAIVALMLLAGLRVEEVCHLTREDLDLDLGLVYVRAKDAPDERSGVWKPKSRHSVREVPMEPQLPPILARHLATYAADRWVFPSASRADWPDNRTRVGIEFKRVAKACGFVTTPKHPQCVTPHTLRHTFASWLVMEGVDLFTVSRLLGHGSTDEVEDTYGHLSPLHKAAAVARIGRRFTLPAAVAASDANRSHVETQEGAA